MTSTCIFGSTARNRADRFSDKDVLLSAASKEELDETAQDLQMSGWSVAIFTHSQLRNMSNRGSLFLQHLKQEGHIIRDDDGFLSSMIDRFKPRAEYENEIADSLALLGNLPPVPAGYWPALCVADIVYGAIRNIAILRLASLGVYKFDYADLINHLAAESKISVAKVESLHSLRILKHGYRNRLTKLYPWELLREALMGAEELFSRPSNLSKKINRKYVGYNGLRMLELDLVTMSDPRDLDRLSVGNPLANVWEFVCDPRYPKKLSVVDERWIQNAVQAACMRFSEN